MLCGSLLLLLFTFPQESTSSNKAPAVAPATAMSSEVEIWSEAKPLPDNVQMALTWLASEVQVEGYWKGSGPDTTDIGVTGLAILALMHDGRTPDSKYFPRVRHSLEWLLQNQEESGLLGAEVGNMTLYNHALATLAMGKGSFHMKDSAMYRKSLNDAVKVVLKARNPYAGWRYSLAPNGDNDTSMTSWMVTTLTAAKQSGIELDQRPFEGADMWFEHMTDMATGRTGYSGKAGSFPVRNVEVRGKFPAEKSEAMTAAALYCRMLMADHSKLQTWRDHPQFDLMKKQADLILKTLPEWDTQTGGIDLYYWYFATNALYQFGGRHWKIWKVALEDALHKGQRKEGPMAGSWDPQVAVWGQQGGRIYATSLAALTLAIESQCPKLISDSNASTGSRFKHNMK